MGLIPDRRYLRSQGLESLPIRRQEDGKAARRRRRGWVGNIVNFAKSIIARNRKSELRPDVRQRLGDPVENGAQLDQFLAHFH